MVERIGNFFSKFYFVLAMIFMYAPIAVLIVLSFNASRSRVVWGGFTLDWYVRLFSNKQIMEALVTTILLALLSSVIATLIGVTGAIGISAMRRHNSDAECGYCDRYRINAVVRAVYAAGIFQCFDSPYYVQYPLCDIDCDAEDTADEYQHL